MSYTYKMFMARDEEKHEICNTVHNVSTYYMKYRFEIYTARIYTCASCSITCDVMCLLYLNLDQSQNLLM